MSFAVIILLIIPVVIFAAGLAAVGVLRTRGQIQRALNMSLFLIRMPQQAPTAPGAGPAQKSEKELIAVSEQLLAGFANIHSRGWNKFLYGEPYLALELAVHHIGEETYFYIAVPKNNEQTVEKQIYAYYPTAEVARIKDYNIFNPEGSAAGAYLIYARDHFLPFRTYQKLESDPMSAILTAMSRLESEGEGASMQILLRPGHNLKLKRFALKVAREMQVGYRSKKPANGPKKCPSPKGPTPTNPRNRKGPGQSPRPTMKSSKPFPARPPNRILTSISA